MRPCLFCTTAVALQTIGRHGIKVQGPIADGFIYRAKTAGRAWLWRGRDLCSLRKCREKPSHETDELEGVLM